VVGSTAGAGAATVGGGAVVGGAGALVGTDAVGVLATPAGGDSVAGVGAAWETLPWQPTARKATSEIRLSRIALALRNRIWRLRQGGASGRCMQA
jgi:hypothetical protein